MPVGLNSLKATTEGFVSPWESKWTMREKRFRVMCAPAKLYDATLKGTNLPTFPAEFFTPPAWLVKPTGGRRWQSLAVACGGHADIRMGEGPWPAASLPSFLGSSVKHPEDPPASPDPARFPTAA